MHKAVGIHVFAGGFTYGVKKVMDVDTQLETHGFGLESAEQFGVKTINGEPEEWPAVDAAFAYGNPRCTGFSTITAGYDESTHGAWAKQTCDIHQLCNYAVGKYEAVIWESVQGATTTGRELLDYLRDEVFVPAGYRIAHVLLNAASFGNSQQRKRYFFVAYKKDRNFNVVPPDISPYYATMYDDIWDMRDRPTREIEHNNSLDYDFDTYYKLTDLEKVCVPKLPNGWNLNMMARYDYDSLPEKYQKKWDTRCSDMPFSMHCIFRTNWMRPSPTLHSSCCRFIHPDLNRPLTIGELSTIMGWEGHIPQGKAPIAQIAKGVCPAAGTWLAEQVELFLNDEWGDEDWESSYNPITATWEGRNTEGALEKTFDLTKYVGHNFDKDRFPGVEPKHLFNIDDHGRVIRAWKEVARATNSHS